MKVSVIVPNYNHAIYLPTRLSSITNQTFTDFEAILLDDASTDNSALVLNEYLSIDKRFSVYYNLNNTNSTFAQWNKGVSIAKGEYIWISESDDYADINLLDSLLKLMESDSEIVLAYCQSKSVEENGRITGTWFDFTKDFERSDIFKNDFVMCGKEYIHEFLLHRNTIPNASAVLFRKSIFKKIGMASEHLKTNGDWLTWLKMLCYGKVAFLSTPLNYFRRHDKSVIAQAQHIISQDTYRERYDFTMRNEFISFLKNNCVQFPSKVFKSNAYYLSLDIGNRGLFKLNNGLILDGWIDIFTASFYPKFQSGFIKKAIGYR